MGWNVMRGQVSLPKNYRQEKKPPRPEIGCPTLPHSIKKFKEDRILNETLAFTVIMNIHLTRSENRNVFFNSILA